MILSDHSIHMIPHQGSRSHLFSLFLIRLFGGAQDREWKEAYMFRIDCKVKNRTQQRKYIIQSDQDVHVCRIFLDGTRTPFYMTLSFYFKIWAIFLFLFVFFFPMLLGTNIFSSASLSHSPYSFCNMKSHVKEMEHFHMDGRHVFASLPM